MDASDTKAREIHELQLRQKLFTQPQRRDNAKLQKKVYETRFAFSTSLLYSSPIFILYYYYYVIVIINYKL